MKIIDFAIIVGYLKRVKRTGWVREDIKNSESVAEHSFRTAVLSLILANKLGLDSYKAGVMGLIHDIGEARIGDIVTGRGGVELDNLHEKLHSEQREVHEIFEMVGQKEFALLFDEFEEMKTPEARLVKQVDKLEMALQAYEYEKEQEKDLEEFFIDAKTRIVDQEIKEILNRVMSLRNSTTSRK